MVWFLHKMSCTPFFLVLPFVPPFPNATFCTTFFLIPPLCYLLVKLPPLLVLLSNSGYFRASLHFVLPSEFGYFRASPCFVLLSIFGYFLAPLHFISLRFLLSPTRPALSSQISTLLQYLHLSAGTKKRGAARRHSPLCNNDCTHLGHRYLPVLPRLRSPTFGCRHTCVIMCSYLDFNPLNDLQ